MSQTNRLSFVLNDMDGENTQSERSRKRPRISDGDQKYGFGINAFDGFCDWTDQATDISLPIYSAGDGIQRTSDYTGEVLRFSGLESADSAFEESTVLDDAVMFDDMDEVDMSNIQAIDIKSITPEICFGMIHDASISNSSGFKKLYANKSASHLCDIAIVPQAGLMMVYDAFGSYYGLLDLRTSNALSRLATKFSATFEAYVNLNEKPSDDCVQTTCFINIYGLLKDFDSVGKLLIDDNIFLQRPLRHDIKFEYRNPQSFEISDVEPMDVDMNHGAESSANSMTEHKRAYTVPNDVAKLLGAATDWKFFEPCEVSNRLSTTLLPHQVEGLAFMRQWEGGSRETSLLRGTELVGGILADEMGLGKSLTALALIAGTLPSWDGNVLQPHGLATLLIVPTSNLSTWQEQIEQHAKAGSFQVLLYYGRHRNINLLQLENADIVLTTYSTLVSDWASNNPAIHGRHWFRVILDEAHYIKDRSTKRAQAIFGLQAKRRWCLTGTPIQNTIDDLSGLLQFLRMHPFQNHREFRILITEPLRNGNPHGLYKLQSVLRTAMLRRTKDPDMLPPRNDFIQELELSGEERELYEIAKSESSALLESALRENDFKKGYTVMQSFLRQRQICNHGADLLPPLERARLRRLRQLRLQENQTSIKENLAVFCEVCESEIARTADESHTTFEFCFHLVCAACRSHGTSWAESANQCPICNGENTGRICSRPKTLSLETWFKELNYSGPSTKVKALIDNIRSSQRRGRMELKSVVFSSWTRMLYLIDVALQKADIKCIRLDGSFDLKERKKILDAFKNDPSITVLLISIGSGGVGLNLTMASEVHLMEPQWNPMVECQALDRVHRLGQKHDVNTTRYIIKSSFDETIINLQKKKLDLVQLSLVANQGTKADMVRKKLEDLRALFK